MGIQNTLDQQAIDILPKVSNAIRVANRFESNQMRCKALQHIKNYIVPLGEMNESQKNEVENRLLHIFSIKGWM